MSVETIRHIVITGAGSGIGHAIALRLSGPDTRLSLLARNRDRLDETAARCREAGANRVLTASCDIRQPDQVAAAFAHTVEQQGAIHSLVANSGIGGPNWPGAEDRFDDLVATNLSGTYYCLRAAQEWLAPGPSLRHFVVISSILGRIGVEGYTGYCASKAGLLGLVRSLAAETAAQHIQVNALCPGWVNTEMAREGIRGIAEGNNISEEEALKLAMSAVPTGRMSEPSEIANVVAWMCSDASRGMTGQALDINNGAFMI